MNSPQFSAAEKAYDFLRRIVRDARVTLLAFPVGRGGLRATSFGVDDKAGIEQWIERHNRSANCYFQVNPLRDDVRDKKATKGELKHVVQLHVDIDDLKGLERLQRFELPPTAVVCSGNGFHAYWHLEEPVPIETGERLNKELAARLQGDTAAHDASRILRVPNTLNIPNQKKV